MSRLLFALLLLAVPLANVQADDGFLFRDGQRVVFLGDSNTFAGGFIAHLDVFCRTRFPDRKIEMLNLGLPSETISGLSEPDHPYPRPDIHERLERVLDKTKPSIVVVCYGMNDGIYYPFSEERFQKYQAGTRKLIERIRKSGARVVLHTPAPFDPQPVRAKLLPKTAEKFSWLRPYEDYDGVLTRYSEWLLTLRGEGLIVADPHSAINRYLTENRKTDPNYRISGDGIHPDATGHWLIAQELLRALKAPGEADGVEIDAATTKSVRGTVADLKDEKGTLQFRWTSRLPLPNDPQWDRRLAEREKIAEKLNRYRLVVRGAEHARYQLFEGDQRLGEVGKEQLAAGVDLLAFAQLSTNKRSAEVGKLTAERQKLLGLAWLSDVGHKRPDTPRGLPLAEAQQKADALEARLRKLAAPQALALRLVPIQ
jgi:lysophospholipase L1-like esterase